ncbi:MAG: GNAT family N-acetyltransferase [Gemmatimonadota bacterium]|jgi:GNAT superfamily N-acetyltransferase
MTPQASNPLHDLTVDGLESGELDEPATRELGALYSSWLREIWPATTAEAHRRLEVDLGIEPGTSGGHVWIARRPDGGAVGGLTVAEPGQNGASVPCWLFVQPEWRGRGIARELLSCLGRFSRRAGVSGATVTTTSSAPAGARLAERLAGAILMRRRMYEVEVGDLERNLLRSRSRTFLADDLALEIFEGPYPEGDLRELAGLRGAIYRTYGHDLGESDVLRSFEDFDRVAAELGLRRIGALARERTPGHQAVGLVETIWDPRGPAVLAGWQEAVVPRRRGARLGASLTAALLLEVERRLPEVRVIRFGTHEDAYGLHGRAEKIGFEPRHRETRWRISSEALQRPAPRAPRRSRR